MSDKPKSLVFVGVKIPRPLAELLNQAVNSNTHTTRSEFIRDALRRELEYRGFTFTKKADTSNSATPVRPQPRGESQ